MLREINTPEWVRHAVFYQIFPDRFASSNSVKKPTNLEPWGTPPTIYGFKGGDLVGIIEKLDYLLDLGINAIYLNPIFQSASNHRYHTHDYFQIDPLLGGNKAFDALLKAAHQNGIRIILDGVFNHASRGFFQFNHILETGASSPYLDWFTVKGFPLNAYGPGEPNYKCWIDLPALPEFNTQNPEVRSYIFDIARYWLEQGIDGWRLDVPFCIDEDAFWQEFRRVVKSANPEAYLVGEVPWEAQRWLQGDQFDAVMNYQFTLACLGFFANKSLDKRMAEGVMGFSEVTIFDASGFARRAEALLNLYPAAISQVQLNLLSSHDMPRFSSLCGYEKSSFRLASLFQMTYPGAPCVYYGDEIGLQNGPTRTPEDCRFAFPWNEAVWDHELLAYLKRCISIRNTYPALRSGEIHFLHAQDDILVFSRQLKEQILIIVINNSYREQSIDCKFKTEIAGLKTGESIQSLLTKSTAFIQPARISQVTIPARSGEIYLAQESSS
jgi:cyclomaltodextrinase